MNAVFTWVLGAIVLFVLLAVFLWPRWQRKTKHAAEPGLNFNEEIAEELAVPPPEQKQEAAPPREMQLPGAYGIDRLVLLVRDPHWLYAYWEISATKQEEFNSSYGPGAWSNSRPVLRVYEVAGEEFNGTNAISYTDIGLVEHHDSWHINVEKANCNYCVDLGRVFPDGRFVTLLRSNVVTTPRESLSDILDEEWMWIEGIYRSLGGLQYGMSSPVIAEQLGRQIVPLGISSPGVTSPGVTTSGEGQSRHSKMQ